MLDPRPLTPLGIAFRDSAPVMVRDDPHYLAIWHASARECERLLEHIELVRDQLFPERATVMLGLWEALVGLTVDPEAVDIDERRTRLTTMLRRVRGTPEGGEWVANVTDLIGPGWSYREHDPDAVGGPPEYTLEIAVPFPPEGNLYNVLEELLRDITPAHLDVSVSFLGGLILDIGGLDVDKLDGAGE